VLGHSITRDGSPMTRLTFPPSSTVNLSAGRIASAVRTGTVSMPRYGHTWQVSVRNIRQLFVAQSVTLHDRLVATEARNAALEVSLAEGARAVIELEQRVTTHEFAIAQLLARIEGLESHADGQKRVMKALVERVSAGPADHK